MKKKIIIIVGLFAAVALLALPNIRSAVQEHKDAEKYDNAYNELFTTEKNAVAELYSAIESTIDTPDNEHYNAALNAAAHAEQVCGETYGELCDITVTYGAGTVYYATFYRDIKAALTQKCGTDDLKRIYELLGKIMPLYNAPAALGSTNKKKKEIENFYKSLSLLNDDMVLTDITEKP